MRGALPTATATAQRSEDQPKGREACAAGKGLEPNPDDDDDDDAACENDGSDDGPLTPMPTPGPAPDGSSEGSPAANSKRCRRPWSGCPVRVGLGALRSLDWQVDSMVGYERIENTIRARNEKSGAMGCRE